MRPKTHDRTRVNGTIDTGSLLDALSLACAVGTDHATKPIYSAVKIAPTPGGYSVTATNGELSVVLPVVGSGNVSCVVNAAKLRAAVGLLPDDEVRIEADDSRVTITGAKTQYKFYTFPVADYPPVAAPSEGAGFSIGATALARLFACGGYAAAQEMSRYAINSIHLVAHSGATTVRAESTDGRRLGQCDQVCIDCPDGEVSVLVPVEAVKLACKATTGREAPVQVFVGTSQVAFACDGRLIVTANVEGNFPDVKKVIPQESPTSVSVDTDTMLSAVKQAGVFTSDEARAVVVTLGGGHVTVTASGPESGDARIELDADVTGPDVTVRFNPAFLRASLRAHGMPRTTLGLGDGMRPVVIRTDDSLHLIMPVSI